jgi:hypothetical protein
MFEHLRPISGGHVEIFWVINEAKAGEKQGVLRLVSIQVIDSSWFGYFFSLRRSIWNFFQKFQFRSL